MHKIEDFKKIYEDTEIPETLEFRVRQSIRSIKMKNRITWGKKIGLTTVASLVIFTGVLNMNQSFAMALSELPIIGAVVKVLTFEFDQIQNEHVNANIEIPIITGLENEALEKALNERYYEESKALYEAFIAEMGDIMEMGGHLGVDSGYVVMTDTDEILSIGRYVVNTLASSSTTFQYDTIDKKEGLLITLPSLFVDDTYVTRISEYLIETMKAQMAEDADKIYWVSEDDFSPFKGISSTQSFYITDTGKLVISFDKYEAAPGYMGVLAFEIPTEVISDLLVNASGTGYIKP